MLMLIDSGAIQKMDRALKVGMRATHEHVETWRSQLLGGGNHALSGFPRNVSVVDGVAEIRVEGVLSETPDFWAWLLYGKNTTYESIRQALALAAADQTIKSVTMFVNSPGGYTEGLFETFNALEAFPKPLKTRAAYACSAAFGVATLSGKIEATTEAASFGSVGVAREYYWDEHIIEIASTEAPKKRPDPKTDEGKAIIREELDALHQLFVDTIARGRGTTAEDVNANYGRGGQVLAAAAKKAKMIDKIAKPVLRAGTVTPEPEAQAAQPAAAVEAPHVPAPASATPTEPSPTTATNDLPGKAAPVAAPPVTTAPVAVGGAPTTARKHMNKDELKAQHPDVYDAIRTEGKNEGLTEGCDKERKRVLAHLKLGEASGAQKVATDAIASGASTLDELVSAEYQAASMKRNQVQTRQTETDAAGKAVDNADTSETQGKKDLGDQIVERLEAKKKDQVK